MDDPNSRRSPAGVTLLTLGGTISMTQDPSGSRAAPSDAQSAAGLADDLEVTTRPIADVGSPSVRPSHLREVLLAAREAVASGAAGVVLSHGTDTLEESAFLLDALWDEEAPLVITGAMRPANAPGADGPANLADALHAAASPALRGCGVLAVFDGCVHRADRVTKASSRSVSAFASEPAGALALVDGAEVRLLQTPPASRPRRIDLAASDLPDLLPRVPVLGLGIGDDGELLDSLAPHALAGLVISGAGMGHVPAGAVPRLRTLTGAGVPVLVATRIPHGGTSTHHYGYPGSETDLLANGCRMAGLLSAHKARLLLQLLLAAGADDAAIDQALAAFAS